MKLIAVMSGLALLVALRPAVAQEPPPDPPPAPVQMTFLQRARGD